MAVAAGEDEAVFAGHRQHYLFDQLPLNAKSGSFGGAQAL
jgi:hypothetical protein